jgi:two-component system chemotaxis sensor kinase CheA
MNEFIEQFILESRDYVEQGSAALAVLQQTPQDADNVDALFRALHTLKGGASIVDFTAMERAVHSAEDELSEVRAGKRPFTAETIADCHACLDQVARWLDTMERTGDLPVDADTQADALIGRLKHLKALDPDRNAREAVAKSDNWSEVLLNRNSNVRQQARTAVRFSPKSDCFFRGEDPFALLSSVPELLALDAEPSGTWPTLGALDPFECIVVLTALFGSEASVVRATLGKQLGDCEVLSLAGEANNSELRLPRIAQDLLNAQIALLNEDRDSVKPTLAGRIAAAGSVAANVFRQVGQNGNATLVQQAMRKSLAALSPNDLVDQITRSMSAPASSESPVAYAQADSALRTLRVNAEQVDALVRLTGELTVVKNAIGHAVKLAQSDESAVVGTLRNQHGVLDHIVGELQRAVLGMRVVPLRTVVQRFPRVVRELTSNLGKSVSVSIEGDETEADKAIVEMLFEPLLHIVRNSMDHGIEDGKTRAERKKAPTATISIRASRQGEHVVIEVEDDGGGIDPTRIRAVALERNVVTSEGLAGMSESDIIDLVFAPGFSTATEVTELSGRGVGMDAVRTAVGRVGGKVSLESRFGRGTTVRFTLPFSVMMTHVMTVEADGQMFGVPLEAVVETIRVATDTIAGIGTARALVRRNRTIPVFDLGNLLRVRETVHSEQQAIVVIVTFAGQLAAIQVDGLGERMQVMLKPLEGLLSGIPGITGTTILGDGRVLLVLDLEEALQ